MNTKELYQGEPDYATPPGALLLDVLEQWNMTQVELAKRLGLHKKTVNDIIKGTGPILMETALNLERVFGISANLWLNAENTYRIRKKRLEENMAQYKDILSMPAIKELKKRGYIPEYSSPEEGVESVLKFFGESSVDQMRKNWENPTVALRHSKKVSGDPVALAAWLRIGYLESLNRQCDKYDERIFLNVLNKIRSFTKDEPSCFITAMIDLCAQSGVALVFVKEFKNAAVNGAACWLPSEKAIILINLRGKKNDIFWFTFFHEAAHILLGRKKECYIDYNDKNLKNAEEIEADNFAASFLIPADRNAELKKLSSRESIIAFADQLGIHPSIVVGRLQHEGIIQFNQMNELKIHYQWKE
ncbi:MAG: HigA family addiction module antitoxin [Planctomycetia bacterium]|nr:HigA family addiction module antitoxin [Planctomycetia bacterium]